MIDFRGCLLIMIFPPIIDKEQFNQFFLLLLSLSLSLCQSINQSINQSISLHGAEMERAAGGRLAQISWTR
jgi:hypothetical protein